LAKFVEEQRAAVRLLNEAALVSKGARKAALAVAEKFGFEERLRNSTAIEGHESMTTPGVLLVNQSRDDFLADSGFSENQHLCIRARGIADVRAQLLDRGTVTDERGVLLWNNLNRMTTAQVASVLDLPVNENVVKITFQRSD